MLILLIKFYRFYLKQKLQKTCLFKVSCSHFVEDEYRSKGPFSGWKALLVRIQDCQPGYQFTKSNEKMVLLTKSGRMYNQEDLSEALHQELKYHTSKE